MSVVASEASGRNGFIVTTLAFLVSLSEYDQTLYEDESVVTFLPFL